MTADNTPSTADTPQLPDVLVREQEALADSANRKKAIGIGAGLAIVAAVAVVVGLLVAGDESAPDADPVVAPVESPAGDPQAAEPVAGPVDITVIPDEITIEYVQAVMDHFADLHQRARTDLIANGPDSEEYQNLTRSFNHDTFAELVIDGQRQEFSEGNEVFYLDNRRTTTVEQYLGEQSGCLLILVTTDNTAQFAGVGEVVGQDYLTLRPHGLQSAFPNRTPWKIDGAFDTSDGPRITERCPA